MRGLILGFILLILSGCKTVPVQPPSEEVSAGMDKEAIRATIRENLVPIRHCYEKELKTKPKLKGKLVLEWDVEDKGKVTSVTVKQSVDPSVDHCIAEVIKSAKFPEPPKGQIGRIAFPFIFTDK
jgi:TonB family protein